MSATKPVATEAIESGTGRSWEDWLTWLEANGARELSHSEIACRVKDRGNINGWWAQYVTVAYEQHIGRRVPGQDFKGEFQVSVTRTIPDDMDAAMAAWRKAAHGIAAFDGVAVARGPRVSATAKWRRWGVTLEDGTRVTASANQKAPNKSTLAVMHEKLPAQPDVERWRAFWKSFLAGV
jgi:hypothetical protein